MNWYLVIGKHSTSAPQAYPSRDVAEAFCHIKQYEYPNLGPWTVREAVEPNPINQDNEE